VQRVAYTLADLGFAGTAEEIDVDAAEDSDAVAIGVFGGDDVFDGVFEGVFGVDADVVDEVVHDEAELSAGVEQVGSAGLVGEAGHFFVAGQDVLAEVGGADEGAVAEAHIVGAPDDLHSRELEHGGDHGAIELEDALGDGGDEIGLFEEGVAEGFVAHEPTEVLSEMGEAAGADDAHVVGEVLLIPLEGAGIEAFGVGPGVGLKFGPTGDGSGVLIDEAPAALASEGGGVLGGETAEGHVDVFEAAADVVVAEESLEGDLAAEVEEGVGGVEAFEEAESLADGLLDFGVDEELDEMDAAWRGVATDALQEGVKVGGNGQ